MGVHADIGLSAWRRKKIPLRHKKFGPKKFVNWRHCSDAALINPQLI